MASGVTIRVLSWNISYGYGLGSEGKGPLKSKKHFEASIQSIGNTIKQGHYDIVALQEVDFASRRSHFVDQALEIQKIIGLPYLSRLVSWKHLWIPYPFGFPNKHFGTMNSGGAVLSRFPIIRTQNHLLPKPSKNSKIYNFFYLNRYAQEVTIAWPTKDQQLHFWNLHLEAFDQKNRDEQSLEIKKMLEAQKNTQQILVGDLNTVPPEALKQSGYPDEPETDHTKDLVLQRFRTILQDTEKSLREQFTFPSHAPNRRLDHILASPMFQVKTARIQNDAGVASDHLPITAEFESEFSLSLCET